MSPKVRENGAQPRMDSKGDMNKITYVAPSMIERLVYCWYMWAMKGFSAPFIWYRDWMEWYYPPDGRPDIVKAYECRPHLPVRYVDTPFWMTLFPENVRHGREEAHPSQGDNELRFKECLLTV